MNALKASLVILAAVIGQAILRGVWPRTAGLFDLPLIVVIYYGIAKGPTGAMLAGTGAGLLQDALEGTLLGVSALSKALVGWLVGLVGTRFALAPLVSRVLVLAAATVLSRSIEVGTLAIMGRRLAGPPYSHLFEPVVGNCLIGALAIGALWREDQD